MSQYAVTAYGGKRSSYTCVREAKVTFEVLNEDRMIGSQQVVTKIDVKKKACNSGTLFPVQEFRCKGTYTLGALYISIVLLQL